MRQKTFESFCCAHTYCVVMLYFWLTLGAVHATFWLSKEQQERVGKGWEGRGGGGGAAVVVWYYLTTSKVLTRKITPLQWICHGFLPLIYHNFVTKVLLSLQPVQDSCVRLLYAKVLVLAWGILQRAAQCIKPTWSSMSGINYRACAVGTKSSGSAMLWLKLRVLQYRD